MKSPSTHNKNSALRLSIHHKSAARAFALQTRCQYLIIPSSQIYRAGTRRIRRGTNPKGYHFVAKTRTTIYCGTGSFIPNTILSTPLQYINCITTTLKKNLATRTEYFGRFPQGVPVVPGSPSARQRHVRSCNFAIEPELTRLSLRGIGARLQKTRGGETWRGRASKRRNNAGPKKM